MDSELRMILLGSVEISWGKSLIQGFNSSKTQALLIYLAVTRRAHTRAHLAGLFWADLPETHAQRNLRKSLANLNQLVGRYLVISRNAVSLASSSPYFLDIAELETKLEDDATYASIGALQQAVELYRGDFLEGFYVRAAPEFEDWVRLQQMRFKGLVITALHRLLDLYAQEEDGGRARSLDYAARLLALDVWREESHQQMMRLLALNNQRSAALAQYEMCCQALMEEFGVEPGPETKRLFAYIRDGDIVTAAVGRVERGPNSPSGSHTEAPPERTIHQVPQFLDERTDAARGSDSAVFVGRENELNQLNLYLELTLAAQGRVTFVSGSAGRGKTALMEAFAKQAQVMTFPLLVAIGHCNTFGGVGDPYLPFQEILECLTGDVETRLAAGLLSREHAKRLWLAMPDTTRALIEAGPDLVNIFVHGTSLLARLQTVNPPLTNLATELAALVADSRTAHRANTLTQRDLFAQYIKVLQLIARTHPLLLMLDDLQWADSGSLSLLFDLGRQLRGHRILVVGAFRREESARGEPDRPYSLDHVVNEFRRTFGNIEIDLDQNEDQRFVDAILDSNPNRFGADFRSAFFRHTKGHALFTVEMLRSMQERGEIVRDKSGMWVESHLRSWDTLPPRVEGVIEERMLQLPATQQEILRVASVEGEQFTAEVIAQLQKVEVRTLIRQLSGSLAQHHQLIKSQSTERLGSQLISHFQFRHILFQKYLYSSIDEVERVYLHEAVGSMLEELYSSHTETIASDLARHFHLARMDAKAIIYLRMAADKAVRSCALHEASALYTKAIELAHRIPPTAENRQREVALQVSLGNLLIAQKGFAAPEVEHAFGRAANLCRQLDVTFDLILVLHGLFRYNLVRAHFPIADELAEQIMTLTRQQLDMMLLSPAELSYGMSMVFKGTSTEALDHLERAISAYDTRQHDAYLQRFGQCPLSVGLSQQALALWYLGLPDQAQQRANEAVEVAKVLAHPFSLAAALVFAAWIHQLRREPKRVLDYINKLQGLVDGLNFPYFEAMGAALGGWATMEHGDSELGCMEIRQGLAAYVATGARLQVPYQQSLLAQAYSANGQINEGITMVDEALATAEMTGEKQYEAETLRIRGTLYAEQGHMILAQQAYVEAIEVARKQQALTLEMRAQVSLCRLWEGHGRQTHLLGDLAVLLDRFTEGFDTVDFTEAQTLLIAQQPAQF